MSFTEEQINEACAANGWVRTGVFAAPEEIELSRQWRLEADKTPIVRVFGRWLHEEADAQFKARIDGLAEKHGLPKLQPIDGESNHYGLLATGEFTTIARVAKESS